MIRLFCGYDPRESIGFHVFVQSVIARASVAVQIIPLSAMGLPQGSNTFTLSRFLIPYLCQFKGHAIFADASDMLMLGDISDLEALFDSKLAAQVVKHPNYQPKDKIKYRGTSMETINTSYARKNWASLMLINCEHPAWKGATPEMLASRRLVDELQFNSFADDEIGELPDSWNRLVDEGHYATGANLLHWTAGVPAFPHYHDAPGAELWHAERAAMERIA